MAQGNEQIAWPVESVPDSDALYYRVHRQFWAITGPNPGAFRDRCNPCSVCGDKKFRYDAMDKNYKCGKCDMVLPGGGMSTDWAKYSTPEDARKRAAKPAENAVAVAQAGSVRAVPGMLVEHNPVLGNRAHTNVKGDKKSAPDGTQIRVLLSRVFQTILPL